jgi:hypothetical protein
MQRALVSLFALATVTLGGACQKQYPNCKAFAFRDDGGEPRLLDEDASPEDCGSVRVSGSTVDDPAALDCALEHIADGKPMRLSLDVDPESELNESWVVFSDEDGLAMRWRNISMDLDGELEARVYELDTGRVSGCGEHEDAGERFSCLAEAFDAAEVVKTCMTEQWHSE